MVVGKIIVEYLAAVVYCAFFFIFDNWVGKADLVFAIIWAWLATDNLIRHIRGRKGATEDEEKD